MIDFKEKIAEILSSKVEELDVKDMYEMIEIPPDSNMGDFAFPCFRLAKIFRKAPPIIAQEISSGIQDEDIFEKVENNSGYVNFFIKKELLLESVLVEAFNSKEQFGSTNIGNGEKVIVEYSSPNIGKIFHFGHLRSTVIGNSIANIYEFEGYDVFRLNYIGDWGTQFGKLITAFKKWGSKEQLEGNTIKTLLELYVRFANEEKDDPSLTEDARKWFKKLEDKDEEATELWVWFREESLKEYTKMYDRLNVKFDSYQGEAFYNDKMDVIVEELEEKQLLEESDGAQVVFLEEYETPCIIKQRSGATLYATRDLASIKYRIENYKANRSLYVVGSEQNLHFNQVFKVAELMGYEQVNNFKHIDFGLVVDETGQKLGTRKGNSVFLNDVIEESVDKVSKIIDEKNPNLDNKEKTAEQIGIGAIIFNDLKNNRIKNEIFKWEDMLNFEGETGPYVQYTHARAASVIRKSQVDIDADIDFSEITGESAFELCKLIYQFPKVITDSANKYEPSIITRHVINIAQAFNKFYHDKQIIVEDKNVQKARLLLVYVTKLCINNGLKLLGMEAPERM